MQSEKRKGPGLERVMSRMCCLRERGVQENMSGEERPIPRSGSGVETTKVSLPSCPSVGQAFRREAHFILCSNISSFYYENYIHTFRTIASFPIFTPKMHPNPVSIRDFFANTISLVTYVFLLFSPHLYHNMLPDFPKTIHLPSLFTH